MPRAGLDPASVTEAGACLADQIGFDRLSIGLVAERLGVKTPSLYKHVTSQADLVHRIAVLGMNEFAHAIGDAIQGRAGTDALIAGAEASRAWVKNHPGRYAAGNAAPSYGPDDPLVRARQRVLDAWAAILRGYQLNPDQKIHALRMVRSILHGFATLEASDAFQLAPDIDDSFTWMIDFLDHGLQAGPQQRCSSDIEDGQPFPEAQRG